MITRVFYICDTSNVDVHLFSREVIKWLFSAIMKSTEHGETPEAARERDELIRLITHLEMFFIMSCSMHEYIIMAASMPV